MGYSTLSLYHVSIWDYPHKIVFHCRENVKYVGFIAAHVTLYKTYWSWNCLCLAYCFGSSLYLFLLPWSGRRIYVLLSAVYFDYLLTSFHAPPITTLYADTGQWETEKGPVQSVCRGRKLSGYCGSNDTKFTCSQHLLWTHIALVLSVNNCLVAANPLQPQHKITDEFTFDKSI